MFCNNCGRLLEEDEKYCAVCGALNETPAATAPEGASEDFVQSNDVMKSEMAGQALKWGIMSLAFSLSGCLSLLGFIFSFVAKSKVNDYTRYYGAIEGRTRVGHILGRVGFGLGLGYTIFWVVYVAIFALALMAEGAF